PSGAVIRQAHHRGQGLTAMRTHAARACARRSAWLAASAFVALSHTDALWAADRQKQVLVLYSSRRDAQLAVVAEREIPAGIRARFPEGINYNAEYIDQGRFSRADFQKALCEFLLLKYHGYQFDAVVAIGNLATDFLSGLRDKAFPQSPVVFYALNPLGH